MTAYVKCLVVSCMLVTFYNSKWEQARHTAHTTCGNERLSCTWQWHVAIIQLGKTDLLLLSLIRRCFWEQWFHSCLTVACNDAPLQTLVSNDNGPACAMFTTLHAETACEQWIWCCPITQSLCHYTAWQSWATAGTATQFMMEQHCGDACCKREICWACDLM